MLYEQSLPQSDKEINFPPVPDFCCLAPDFDSKDALSSLLAHLHREGKHAYYWLASEAKHPASHKRAGDAIEMLTVWFPAGSPAPIPSDVGQTGPLHIYFGVHPTSVVRLSPRRATNSTIDVVNCLYAEIDLKDHGADWQQVWSVVQAAHVPPSVILFSGGGLHLYWLLQRPYHLTIDIVDLAREDYEHIVAHSDGTKAIRKQNQERFAHIQGVQRRWVESQYDPERKIGMDQNAKDMTRVLRLPGTINYKSKYAPHFPTVTFLKADFDLTYSLAELESYVPAPSQKPSTEPAARSNKSNTPRIRQSDIRTDELGRKPGCLYPEFGSQQDKAAFFLNRLDPSCSRAEWIRIGMSLTELGDAGLDLWDRWSSDSHKYKEGEPARIWESFKRSGVGLGTLIKMAQDANPLPNAPTWNDLYPDRPLGGRQHYNQPTDEELELQAKMMGQRSARKGQPIGAPGGEAEARHTYHHLDVQAIGEEIVSLFCPSKTNYGFLNPPGVKSKDGRDEPITKASSKRDGQLTPDAIRKAFNHSKRQVRIEGKRKRVHTSIITSPIDDEGMTRVLAIGATLEGAENIQEYLSGLGLDSIRIQVSELPKVCRFPTSAIPYIYREGHISPLGEIAEGHERSTFGSEELEKPSDKKSDTLREIAEGHERSTFGSDELEKPSDQNSNSGTLGEIAEGQDLHTFGSEELEKQSDKKSDTLPEIAEGHERHTFGSEELEKSSDKKGDTLPEIAGGQDLHTFGSDELEKSSDKKSDTLPEIAEGHERHTFGSDELEKLTYQVMVLFDNRKPASLVQALALDVIALCSTPRLALPLSRLLVAGMSEPTIARKPIRNSVMLSSGETIQMGVPYRGWAKLLNSYRFATGEDLVAAWRALPSRDSHEGKKRVQPQTRYRRPDNVGQSDESVIRWFNRRHDLSDFGIDVSGSVAGCPLCDGQMLLWWDVDRACHCAWCSCTRQLLTPFEMRRIRDGISHADLAAKIRDAHHLGGVGEVRVLGQEQEPELARKLEEHLAKVERLRNAQLEQMRVVEKGEAEVHIFKGTPGIGKSYAAIMVQAEWLQMGERTGITTATRQQSEAWYAGSVKRNSPIKIYQTLAELCDCHPEAKKKAALAKGWRLKHAGSCAYVQQAQGVTNNKDKRNWLFRHNHLAIKNGQLLTPFANTISDESIVDALLPQDSADVMSDLLRLLDIMERHNEPIECQQLVRTLFHVANEAQLARYSDIKGSELIELLRDKLGDLFEVSLEDAIRAVRKTSHCMAHILIGNNKDQTTDDQPLADDYSNLRKVWLPNLLNALEHDLRNPINPLLALVQKAKKKGENKLAYDWHKKLSFLPNQRHGRHFILDASADPKVYQELLSPWRIRFHLTDVPLSPAVQLFQIKGLNLTKNELERNLPNIVAKVAYLANQQRWQFETLITHKEHEDAIADMLHIHTTLHYRNQRGSNSMKGSKCHLVFGNPNVPTSAILRKAHALRSHTHQPIERYQNGAYFQRRTRGMWLAKDKWLRAVAEMMQLEELIQAIHRARAILITEGQIIVYVGDYDLSACGLNPFVLDAYQLHANRKAVQQALASYRDRVANHFYLSF